MAWSDIFLPSGALTADQQQALFDQQKQVLAQKLAAAQANGTVTPLEAQQDQALIDSSLSSQDAAATIGAVQGATEIVTDPVQWASDTAAGAGIVNNAAQTAVSDLGSKLSSFGTNWIKTLFGAVPWWAWVGGGVALFFFFGGGSLLRGRK